MIKRRSQILNKIPELKKQAAALVKLKELTNVDLTAARKIVLDHIIKHKRKIYGGLAIHFALLKRNYPGIYESIDDSDIDFYSPDPGFDVIQITNELIRVGYLNISAKEAQHFGTLKIRTKFYEVTDITYCWSYHFNRIPFDTHKDGLRYVAPQFQIIDTYNTFIDPLFGWFKIENNLIRASYLEQLYLVKWNPDVKQDFEEHPKSKEYMKYFNKLTKIFENREDLVLIDVFVYNIFMKESKLDAWENRLITCDSLMAYSQTAGELMKDIIIKLKVKKYQVQVYRPFLEKYGESFKLIVDDQCILTLFSCDFCLPCKCWNTFQIGSYHVVLRMFYILKFFAIRESQNDFQKYSYMIHHLQYAREMWLRKHHKLGIEKNLFQELQISCLGSGFVSQKSLADDRLLQNKRFKFFPTKVYEGDLKKYVYPNTSGRMYKIIDEKGNAKFVNNADSDTFTSMAKAVEGGAPRKGLKAPFFGDSTKNEMSI